MLSFNIDNVQVFRRFLIIEGWVFDAASSDQILVCASASGEVVSSEVEWSARSDVVGVFPQAPLTCGFTLRAILPSGLDIMTIGVGFTCGGSHLSIPKPWEKSVAEAYRPLDLLNQRFFQDVRNVPNARVLEIGARARSGIVRRQMFGEAVDYTGLDIKEGENVDIVGDAHALSDIFATDTFDFAYSVSVFEHLMWPWKAALELGHVLKIGGLSLMQSHPVWPKHEMPWDFFRFWDSGWRALFCEATGFEVLETVEVHGVDLVSRPFTGSYVHHWEHPEATLASSILARKVSQPQVSWAARPPLTILGPYPA